MSEQFTYAPLGAVQPERESFFRTPIWQVLQLASVGVSAYHGYKRNDSVGWAIVWGLLGGLAPVITPAVALAQGFGKRRRQS